MERATITDPKPYEPDPNRDRMVGLITGALANQVVRTLAQFGIPDLLAKDAATADEIARAIDADPSATARLLRAATALELVSAGDDGRYATTDVLRTLESGGADSLRGWAIIMGSKGAWDPWRNMVDAVKTGKAQAVPALGRDYWAYLEGAPVEREAFATGMAGISNAVSALAARAIDASAARLAVDVGGGTGSFALALVAANPALRGIVYDMPSVAPLARGLAADLGLADRVAIESGDFFQAVPAGDLYLLKWILHDWDDAHCVKILTNCRRAMRPGGRVVALELRIGEATDPGLPVLMDLNMLSITNGRERTAREYGELFAAAGLRLASATDLAAPLGPWSVLEATAA